MNQEVIEQLLVALAMLAMVAVPFYWDRVLGLATSMQRTGGFLNDGELGLAEIQLMPGWKGTTIRNNVASIQATDRLRRRFLIVISESREDFTGEMDLARFAQVTFGHLCGPGPIVEIHRPEPRTVGQFEALQTEAVMILRDRYLMKYLHTVISGERAFHQVIAWTTPSTYDRRLFEQLIDGFRERPGPKPSPTPVRTDGRSSSYGVH
jgi:hypothetical protein